MDGTSLNALATVLGLTLMRKGESMVAVESMTGGLVSSSLTGVPGASRWFEGGVVSYSRGFKNRAVNVPEAVVEQYGTVSRECAEAMVTGAMKIAGCRYGLAITGEAGPKSAEQPVGTVWLAWGDHATIRSVMRHYGEGDRNRIREAAARDAIAGLTQIVNEATPVEFL